MSVSLQPRTDFRIASSISRSSRRPLQVAAFAVPRPPLDEGPGTGKRHYPTGAERLDLRKSSEVEHHDLMSTEACYRLFPLVTHASTPLRIEDSEPAGRSVERVGDAGPTTGRRRRPAPADSSTAAQRPVLPYPDAHADLRREWLARHAPEVLLAARQQTQAQQRPDA